ncbi:MAG: hypothetical protein L6R39_002827 [Caloplaca ligustica]|nr:MAG: hypothetical protein L6R39_002827 [Caloplaca ligustica]
MRHRLLSHGRAVRILAENALSNGLVITRHFQLSTRCGCSRNHRYYQSALVVGPQIKNLLDTKSPNSVSQEEIPAPFTAGLRTLLDKELLNKARTVLQSPTIPDAALVEETLEACEKFARLLAEDAQSSTRDPGPEHTPASHLLSLEENQNNSRVQRSKHTSSLGLAKNPAAQLVSSIAYKIINDPMVFITPKLLERYVSVQAFLARPRSFPEVFHLYASKAIPKPNSNPVQYTNPSSNKPSAHIPLTIANIALTAAIKTKDLPLCFDIIDYTVCAPAYRVSKFLRKAFVPLAGAILAPFAIYKLASELSTWQSTMDAPMATQVLFAGILAYVGFTATIGFVAVTTANDQMDRVTWAIGTPLRERWMREEERMLVDRVAGAWGFQQRWRRGEEEGEDWEALREWTGMRGMVLDKTELMDGME